MKLAYPQDLNGVPIESPHNLSRWMEAMQKIYSEAQTIGLGEAFRKITSNWSVPETLDFKQWMKFYQEDGHMKYKIATHLEHAGGFIPMDALKASLPKAPNMDGLDVSRSMDEEQAKTQADSVRKELIDNKLRALVSRLNSAEKISSQPEIQRELNKVLPNGIRNWFASLQELKREIQLYPIRSTAFLNDLVYLSANRLVARGDRSAAKLLIKIADMGNTSGPLNEMGVFPANPIDGAMYGYPIGEGSLDKNDPLSNKSKSVPSSRPLSKDDFLMLLDSDEKEDLEDDEEELVVEAQMATEAPPMPIQEPEMPAPELEVMESEPQMMPEENIEVVEESGPNLSDATEDPFNEVLSGVTIHDLITRLEGVASLFKNRQIARQLSICDLIMDKLGVAVFFPTMSEMLKSSLDSNTYCQTRIEEILAKLRGSVNTPASLHMEDELIADMNNPQVEKVKSDLAQQEEAEKARKLRRKQKEIAEETAALQPQQPPLEQELAGPAQIEPQPPQQIQPQIR